jgi:hypothetical protein
VETSIDFPDLPGDPNQNQRARDHHGSNEAARLLLARPARGFVRFLYSSNPFYILSADLVFVGLRISFGSGGPAPYSWGLALGLAGYTLLLATTACFLIRAGKLWDDLRSILLLIVMMFIAMAMSFDDTMAADPRSGWLGYICGFLFAVVVTEAVLGTIRLRLPGWYRAAYYAILGLIFLYPIVLGPFLSQPESPALQWALFGFSPLAALLLLLLVPAARGGAAFVTRNGSPWRWPLFPWSLFFVMAGGIGVRCYALCVSFHYVGGSRTIFGPYFLVPIGLALAAIWLEIGIAARRKSVMTAASVMPLALVFLATMGHRYEPVYLHFLELFREALGGSPVFLALLASAAFHVYAAARRAPYAWELLAADLVGLAAVGPNTFTIYETVALRPLPLAAAGLVLGRIAWRGRYSGRAAVAAGLFVAALTRGYAEFWPHADTAVILLHLVIVALMTIGALFADWLGQFAQSCAWIALLGLGVGSGIHVSSIDNALPAAVAPWYPLCVMVASAAYGLFVRDRRFLMVAGACLAAWVGYTGLSNYLRLRRILTGLDQIACGLMLFLVAAAISLRKAGLWPRLNDVTAPTSGSQSEWVPHDTTS